MLDAKSTVSIAPLLGSCYENSPAMSLKSLAGQTPQITDKKEKYRQKENTSLCPIFMNCEQKPRPQKLKGTTQTCKIETVLADGEAMAECIIQKYGTLKKIHLFRKMRKGVCLHHGITDRMGLISTF